MAIAYRENVQLRASLRGPEFLDKPLGSPEPAAQWEDACRPSAQGTYACPAIEAAQTVETYPRSG
ncbi:hypothetical protein GCM10009555_028310 [Acrocarpospora macrocephala]|uniref:Uncharacterized protein n=1 Tax=Acrocarpospora macrocephala TaxID=150177 RepID=A0A5M3X467_9ACTN|nr:hypothetical protein Amac_094680 [Acrocarpospora macrocephala]